MDLPSRLRAKWNHIEEQVRVSFLKKQRTDSSGLDEGLAVRGEEGNDHKACLTLRIFRRCHTKSTRALTARLEFTCVVLKTTKPRVRNSLKHEMIRFDKVLLNGSTDKGNIGECC